MNEQQFKHRTKQLAIRILKMLAYLPETIPAKVIKDQVARSSTSVAANYRAACRARSRAMMAAKLDIVLEEADETLFWIELLVDLELLPMVRLQPLLSETDEIIALTVASLRTLRSVPNATLEPPRP
jgi:four helix bundle protein